MFGVYKENIFLEIKTMEFDRLLKSLGGFFDHFTPLFSRVVQVEIAWKLSLTKGVEKSSCLATKIFETSTL